MFLPFYFLQITSLRALSFSHVCSIPIQCLNSQDAFLSISKHNFSYWGCREINSPKSGMLCLVWVTTSPKIILKKVEKEAYHTKRCYIPLTLIFQYAYGNIMYRITFPKFDCKTISIFIWTIITTCLYFHVIEYRVPFCISITLHSINSAPST